MFLLLATKATYVSINGKGCLAAFWRQNASISAEEIVTFEWWFGGVNVVVGEHPHTIQIMWEMILFEDLKAENKSMKGRLLMRMMRMMRMRMRMRMMMMMMMMRRMRMMMMMMMMMNQDEVEKDFPVEMNHWASVLRIK